MKYILTAILLFNVAFGQSLFGVVASDGFDIDARRYLDSAGITNTSQRASFNTFVKGLKNNNLWSKMSAIYPFMGGSASAHKWNAKDVRDVDAAYRLTFPNGATHDANGITFNGSNQYANTFFNPSTAITDLNQSALGIYNRTNNAQQYQDIGAGTNSPLTRFGIACRWSDLGTYYDNPSPATGRVQISGVTNGTGLFILSRVSSTDLRGFRNGSQFGSTTTTTNTGSMPNRNITIGALNDFSGSISFFSNRNYCFSFIVNGGLTTSEVSTLSSLINTLQTALGRNTY